MLRNTTATNSIVIADNPPVFNGGDFAGLFIVTKASGMSTTVNRALLVSGSAASMHSVIWNNNNTRFDSTIRGSSNTTVSTPTCAAWSTNGWGIVTVDYVASTKTLTVRAQGEGMSGVAKASGSHAGTLTTANAGMTLIGNGSTAYQGNIAITYGAGTLSDAQFDALYAALLTNGSVWGCHKAFVGMVTGAWHIGLAPITTTTAKIGDAVATVAIASGTATAGGASTITLAVGSSGSDDFYNNYAIAISSGTGSGQSRLISDYVGGTRVATVSVAWTTPPDATSVYAITSSNIAGQRTAGGSQHEIHPVVSVTGTITHVAPDDYAPAGGWGRTIPSFSVPTTLVANPSPVAKKLALNTADRLYRVGLSSNSRAIGVNDAAGGDGSMPGGIMQLRLASLAGVLACPASDSSSSPRLLFSTPAGVGTTGTVQGVSQGGSNNQADFSRIGSGSGQTGSNGPAAGLYLASTATYTRGALSADDGTTGLVDPDKTLYFRTYYLKFPGAGTLRWQTAKGTASNALSTLGSTSDIACDTATDTHAFNTGTDSYTSGTRTLVLTTGIVFEVGNVIYNANRTAMAQIESITNGGGTKTIVLRHVFQTAPSNGDTFHIGPFTINSVETTIAADAVNVWRGMKHTAVSGAVYIMAHDAWVNETGWVIGGLGHGGNGYDTQLSRALAGAWAKFYEALDLDLLIHGMATQNSGEDYHDDYYIEAKSLSSSMEVFEYGESAHAQNSTSLSNQNLASYHNTLLAFAAARGLGGLSVVQHENIGEYGEQMVNGWREDTAHYSARGALALAAIMLSEMQGLPDPSSGTRSTRDRANFRLVRNV